MIDYSDCYRDAPSGADIPSPVTGKVTTSFKSSKPISYPTWHQRKENRTTSQNETTVCSLIFEIPEPLGPPVFLYYRLTNFYQNHRRYVQSLDIDQLKGVAVDNNTIKGSTCDPLTIDNDTGKAYYPCGLIANSMFNDTIYSPVQLNANTTYDMSDSGIAWPSDKKLIQATQYKPWQVVPPPNWRDRYPNYTEKNLTDLHKNEAFMVWMRTAGLPTFSKLSRRNDSIAMAAGVYQLDIDDCKYFQTLVCSSDVASLMSRWLDFNVTKYGGTKSILISTRTVMGGKNPFMGIAYVVVGGICVVLGVLFTVAHLVKPR